MARTRSRASRKRRRILNDSPRRMTTTVVVAFIFWALPAVMLAQGIVFPRRCPGPWPLPPRTPCIELESPLPIKSINFTTTINGQVARTHVEQVFLNPNRWAAEGTFYFPIPESASIEEFALWVDGKRVVGELVEREKARQTYNDIVRQLRDPGLLEYVGKNLFQARVFPIAPGSEQKIEIRFSQVLKSEHGTVKYEYPLGAGHNTLRQPIGSVAGRIALVSNVPIKNIYSPTYSLEVTRSGETRAAISFEQSQVTPDQDFVLYYALSEKEFGLSLLTHREKGKEGYFLALLSPKVEIKEKETVPKDIVFVLDTSGSMSEEGKLDKAIVALKFGIRSLHAGDRFNVVHFASDEHVFETKLLPATPANFDRGIEYVSKLEANGGTDIDSALEAALTMFSADARPHFVVFLTDGLPTVGEQNISRILARAKEANASQARIFAVGVGYDVNTHLLDPLADETHGLAEYIAPKEEMETRVSNIFTKVNSPVLTHLKLDFGDVKVIDLYPKSLPDLFKGSQLVLLGRYTTEGSATVKLTGEVGGGKRELPFSLQTFPAENSDNDFIPRLWAVRRVGFLLDQIRLNGESKEVKDEITRLATKYGIATPYTSFLITEQDRRPVPMLGPGSGHGGGVGRASGSMSLPSPAMSATMDMSAQSGPGAVQTSQTLHQFKAAEHAGSSDLAAVRHVRDKTFVLKNEVWTDSEFDAQLKLPVVKLEFGSEEYLKLAVEQAGLAEYFSLGKKVVVVFRGRIYEVNVTRQ
jgi:uncharacterized protein YegL